MNQQNNSENRQPVKRLRDGTVGASIWRQESQNGPFFNVTLERSYQDDNEQWQYSNSLGRYDLLSASKLLDRAHTWIVNEDARLKAEARAKEGLPSDE